VAFLLEEGAGERVLHMRTRDERFTIVKDITDTVSVKTERRIRRRIVHRVAHVSRTMMRSCGLERA